MRGARVPWRLPSPLALELGTVGVILRFAFPSEIAEPVPGFYQHQGFVWVMQIH